MRFTKFVEAGPSMVAVALAAMIICVAPGFADTLFPEPDENAQGNEPFSTCIALAQDLNRNLPVQFASLVVPASSLDQEVTIQFSGHSTYVIETPAGVRIATDYAGFAVGRTPDIVTMNNAHSSHYTMIDNPDIDHMLPGWGKSESEPARHRREYKDVFVRNVTTDISRFGEFRADGNSVFIFEVAGLCIGHLGHLHHRLTETHFAEIGRLDIVMVPIDGGLTMAQTGMAAMVDRFKSRIVLPMHRRGNSVESFTALLPDFEARYLRDREIRVSARTLPDAPTIMILPNL
ncbi:MAG: MBL fold metallo-hydrolase [Pseudomonadota bacterium]